MKTYVWDVSVGDPGYPAEYQGTVRATSQAQAKRLGFEKYGYPANRGAGVPKSKVQVKKRGAVSNPGKSVRLKNFTGTVKLNPNKTVSVVGRKKANSARSVRKRVGAALKKYVRKNPKRPAKFGWSVVDGYGHTLQNFTSKADAQRMVAQWRREWANADRSLTGRLKVVKR